MAIWTNGTTSALAITATAAGAFTFGAPPPPPPPDTEWEGPGAAELTVTLTVDQMTAAAPAGVHFYVNVTGSAYTSPITFGTGATGMDADNPAMHQQHVVVHTGDTGHYDTPRAVFSAWTSKAFQYGHFAKHVYHNQGSYNVRAYVYDDDGKWGVSTLATVTVADPDSFATSGNRIVVSNDPSETWADAPAHSTINRCTTLAQIAARIEAVRSAGLVEVLFHGGQTFVENWRLSTNTLNNFGGATRTIRFRGGAWGSTARTTINDRDAGGTEGGAIFGVQNSDSPGVHLSKLDFILDWDSLAESNVLGTGGVRKGRRVFTLSGGNAPNITFCMSDLTVSGTSDFAFSFQSTLLDTRQIMFSNVRLRNGQDYGIFQTAGRVGLLGVSYETEEGYPLGSSGRNRHGIPHIYHAHANLRESLSYELYIRCMSSWHRHAWPGANDGRIGFSLQPSWRINDGSTETIVNGRSDKVIYVADCMIEGSFGSGGPNRWPNMVIENVMVIRNPTQPGSDMVQIKERTTLRNVLIKQFSTAEVGLASLSGRNSGTNRWPDANTTTIGVTGSPIKFQGPSLSDASRARVINCQFENYRGAAVDMFGPLNGVNLVESNNIVYAPNLGSPVIPSGGVTTAALPFTISDGWFRWVFERFTVTLSSALADGATSGTFSYPNDWYNNPLTQESFSGAAQARNALWGFTGGTYANSGGDLLVAGSRHINQPTNGHFTVNHGASGFTITNTSGVSWPSGTLLELSLDRGTTLMAADFHPDFAIPSVEKTLVRVAANVTPDAGPNCLFFADRTLRPGAGYAISPAGSNTKGPLPPAA